MHLLLVAAGHPALACELRCDYLVMGGSALHSLQVDFRPKRPATDGLTRSAALARKLAWRMVTASFSAPALRPHRELALLYEVKAPSFLADGRSADLALTLAILIDFAQYGSSGVESRFPALAATGTVEADGSVGAVAEVASKVDAALAAFADMPHACIFIPSANLAEVAGTHSVELRSRRIVAVTRLQDALDEIAARETRQPGALSFGSLREPIRGNPYRGLDPFRQADRACLFGRQEETAAVLDRLADAIRPPCVLILGSSGSGKSSLLMGGVMGALLFGKAHGQDYSASAGQAPWRPSQAVTLDEAGLTDSLRAHLQRWMPGHALVATDLRALAGEVAAHSGEGGLSPHWLLAIDQLEELFAQASNAQAITPELEALADFLERLHDAGVWIIATLRSEFLGWLGPLRQRLFRQDTEFLLLPPATAETSKLFLREVILGPAELAAVTVEPALLEQLEADAQTADALPLLQFALHELYERAACTSPAVLTLRHSDYRALGGIAGSIDATAAKLLASTPSLDHPPMLSALARLARPAEDEARWLRASVEWDDYSPKEQGWIAAWLQARLLVRRGAVVEVAHEALLNHFEILRQWLDQHHQLLAWRHDKLLRDMRDWSLLGQLDDHLLAAKELRSAERALRQPNLLSTQEAAYAQKSIDAERRRREREAGVERQRATELQTSNELLTRNARRLRQGVYMLAVVMVSALGAASVAWYERAQAQASARTSSLLQAVDSARASLVHGVDTRNIDKLVTAYRGLHSDIAAEGALLQAGSLLQTQKAIIDARLTVETAGGAIAISPDGRLVALARRQGGILLCDADTGATRVEWEAHSDSVQALAFSPDGTSLASVGRRAGSDSSWLRVWHLPKNQADAAAPRLDKEIELDLISMPWHGLPEVDGIGYSPDGRKLIANLKDGTLRLIDIVVQRPTVQTWHTSAKVVSFSFSPDGMLLAVGQADGRLQVWNVDNGRPAATWKGHGGAVTSVVYVPGGSRLVSTSLDGTVIEWDAATGRATAQAATGSRQSITAATLLGAGRALLMGASDGTLTLRPLQLGADPDSAWPAQQGAITALVSDAAGSRFVARAADRSVYVWRIPTQPINALSWQAHDEEVDAVVYAPDGSLLSASRKGVLQRWKADTGRPDGTPWVESETPYQSIAYSPDGSLLATAGYEGIFSLFQAGTRRDIAQQHDLNGFLPQCVAFSPDSKLLVWGGRGGRLWLWNAATGAPIGKPWSPLQPAASALSLAFSQDGREVLSGHADGSVRRWAVQTGQPLGEPWTGHRADVLVVAFSPDGRRALSASADRTVRLWNTQDASTTLTLRGHEDAVNGAAFLSEGQRVVSASSDGTVRYWDAETGQQIGPLWLAQNAAVTSIAVAPDQQHVAASSVNGMLHVFLTPARLAAVLCASQAATDCAARSQR